MNDEFDKLANGIRRTQDVVRETNYQLWIALITVNGIIISFIISPFINSSDKPNHIIFYISSLIILFCTISIFKLIRNFITYKALYKALGILSNHMLKQHQREIDDTTAISELNEILKRELKTDGPNEKINSIFKRVEVREMISLIFTGIVVALICSIIMILFFSYY